MFEDEQRRDQKTANNKKDIHANKPAAQSSGKKMIQHDGCDRDCPQAVKPCEIRFSGGFFTASHETSIP